MKPFEIRKLFNRDWLKLSEEKKIQYKENLEELNKTLPFIEKIANLGLEKACASDNHLANGLNIADGEVRHPSVEAALNS